MIYYSFFIYFQHFKETDYKKSISIPIIQDNQYTGNADFLVILKNPGNGAGLGFPSASRVNIVDDDGNIFINLLSLNICWSVYPYVTTFWPTS